MILYHGSNVEVSTPRLIPSRRLLDFGGGFYLTSDFEQAKKWSVRTASNRETGAPIVSVFEFDINAAADMNVLKFEEANKEWLNYITRNRTGKSDAYDYDIVIGPVANDQAIRTVNNYIKGYFSEEIAIQLLLTQKLKDQYTFKTEKAMTLLGFMEAKKI